MWFLVLVAVYVVAGLLAGDSRRAVTLWITAVTVVVVVGHGAQRHLL